MYGVDGDKEYIENKKRVDLNMRLVTSNQSWCVGHITARDNFHLCLTSHFPRFLWYILILYTPNTNKC